MVSNCLGYADCGRSPLTSRHAYNYKLHEHEELTLMKKDIHPKNYRLVVFQDLNNNQTYLTKSTVATNETITLDGAEYPLVKVHITGSSHPFYTGEERVLDIEGRVDKFKARAAAAEKAKEARMAAAKKLSTRAAAKAADVVEEKSDDKKADK